MPTPAFSSMAPTSYNDKSALNRSMIAPSPTLTNPDMILPYGRERETSTPSPPFEALQRAAEHSRMLASSYSPMRQRSTSVSTTTSFDQSSSGHDESRYHYAESSKEGSPQVVNSSMGNGFTRTQFSEIENTLRSHSRRPSRNNNSVDSLVDSGSGLIASDGISKRHSKLKELQDLPEDFFEHEKAQLEEEQAAHAGADDLSAVIFEPEHRILPMGAIAEEDEEDDEKADKTGNDDGNDSDDIDELTSMLENAKLRLTHMEGNLNRARTSFRMTPSPSPSLNRAFANPGGSYKPLAKGERRAQTSLAGALLRQRAHQGISGNTSSHIRGQSDLYSPSSQAQHRLSGTKGQFRSYSALGSTSASGYRNEFFSSMEEQYDDKESNVETGSPIHEISVDRPRSQTPSSSSRTPSIVNGQSRSSPLHDGDIKSSPALSKSPPLINKPTSDSRSITPPSPANSQLQMLGLQGQVDGLRSKLSTLKERTQEESIRRRSQQSLRTPSPFTVADQSYANPLEYQRQSSYPETLSTPKYDKPQSPPTRNEEIHDIPCKPSPPQSVEEKKIVEAQESGKRESIREPIQESVEKIDDSESEYFEYSDDGSEHSDNADIDRQALAEILREPLDSPGGTLDQELLEEFPAVPAAQETIRHEDRIDAFDYEHFILHSALGTYSGEATFATATEGEDDYRDVTSPNGHETFWDGEQPTTRNKSRHYTEDSLTIPPYQYNNNSPAYSSTQSVSSTPRASVVQGNVTNEQNAALLASISELQKAAATPPTPSLLVRSLISSAANENASNESGMYSPHSGTLNDADAELVEAVIQSLGNVSLELLRASTTDLKSAIDNRIVTILRRRLEAARRVLDGLAPLEANS
ncbi:uncharacterized protein GIQ15_02567 [Arthroderma uncinatum]|uniref:uncharacterized protein n=1 Tax=Arthroderma uncinatum TaxID=74035 RepID=UPI00144A6A50|nr:uncharacterized protein GIQ15_02567 [Arthroderma uncinatum]KAF3483243.1 hypothetical protein GIQ15_02567 [Arthroderma uncinatum]